MDMRITGQKSPPWQLEYARMILDIVWDSDRAVVKSPEAAAELDDSVESTTGNVVNVLHKEGNTIKYSLNIR